jgi:hypothetical protein
MENYLKKYLDESHITFLLLVMLACKLEGLLNTKKFSNKACFSHLWCRGKITGAVVW